MSMSDIHADISETTSSAQGGQGTVGDYWALLKPRVMSLVIFTALAGLVAAPADIHPWLALVALIAIAVGAGASGALNMWYDADIDAVMARTANRPVPRGAILPGEALGFGIALAVGSVLVLGLLVNIVAGALLAFTIFFYAVVYSVWLKRSTPQNIVIGGAAGAFPPMIGWVAATGHVSLEAVLMFSLIFMWTPPHFWALALFMKEDYHKAGVPMLTVTHGRKATRAHILVYTLLLAPVAIGATLTQIGGPLSLAVAVTLNAWLIFGAFRIKARDEAQAEADGYAVEKAFFRFSLAYLFLHFTAFLAEAGLRGFGLGGW
jgi:protoheme IX farnesyltransferase